MKRPKTVNANRRLERSDRAAGAEGEAAANASRPTRRRMRRPTAPAAAPELPAATPEERLAALAAERDEMKDRMLRVAAEFENWKKRARKEQTDAVDEARERVLQGHARGGRQPRARGRRCRRAATASSTAPAVLKGVDLVLRLLQAEAGALRGAPVRGDRASRSIRACTRRSRASSTPEIPSGAVAAELQKGYRVGERLLRPALVSVSTGAGKSADAAVGGLAACPPTTTRRWASIAARPTPRSRSPTASSRSGGTPIATPATRRPRSGSRSWRSPTPCCPTTTSGGTTIASAPSTGRARSAAPTSPARPSSSTRCSAICSGCSAGARPPGATCATRWSWTSRRRRWAARRSWSSSGPRTARRAAGTGAEGGSAGLVTCTRCGGEGVIRKKAGFLTSRRDCMGCGGTGQVPRVRCATCEGAGLVDRERRYTVRIPPGSTGGSTQRVPREGGAGAARRAAGRPARHRARAPAPVLHAASRRARATC